MHNLKHFNIRVYGIIINEKKEVLLSDEFRMDRYMTKFPGGGLRFGEGPEDCILRELKEELMQEAENAEHFYTTGFFQKALFYDDQQLISIYYRIKLSSYSSLPVSQKPFDFPSPKNGSQSFRWASVESLTESDLSFPVDQYVLLLLKQKLTSNKL